MKFRTALINALVLASATALTACGSADEGTTGPGGGQSSNNPFTQDFVDEGKADTGYVNPDGIEVEVDLEGDVKTSSYRVHESPAFLAQFATTYLRQRREFYLESLAEDSTSEDRVEWLVDGTWITASKAATVATSKLTHWRLRGVNAVLLNEAKSGVKAGTVFQAEIPMDPFNVMSAAGSKCADYDSHMPLSQDVYWYLWNPEKTSCTIPTQQMKLTVSKMFAAPKRTYPEYDKLMKDGKVTAVVLFGQIGDGAISPSDPGMTGLETMAEWLIEGGFHEVTPAPIGRRFSKHIGTVDMEIDLYSPHDFSGLGDFAHFDNFQKALSEHEIVVYDGHSMLGASDFWSRPDYPSNYQMFLYGGCLGYEYYVKPIVEGKGGWKNLDMVSSVIEVTASANEFAAPILARIAWSLNHKNKSSWPSILKAVRESVGDSTFGASGVRDNCWSPSGSMCQ
jgi:hypothetical protein